MFALPTLGSSILQSLNGSINAVWVGRFLGEDALAATSNANLVMFLMFAGVFGFGMAATILVGQSMGRRDIDGARRVMGSAIGMFVLLAVLIAIMGWIYAPALLHLLDTGPIVFPLALDYLRVIFLGMPPSFLAVLLMMGLRGTGDSMTPLWFMGLGAVIDVGLNPVMILGLGPAPRLGIAGSAMATLAANYISLVALIAYIQARDLSMRLRGAEWRYLWPDPKLLKVIVLKGFPMGLQMLVMSLSALTVIGLVNREGVSTTAAYGITSQLWTYIQMPALALGGAVSAMAAQNIGAGKWDRVARIARSGVWMNVLLTGAMVVALTLVDRQVLGLFLPKGGDALPIARHIHLVVSWSFVLFGITLVLSGVVRANGAVLVPLMILFITAIPVRLGIAITFLPRFGADAIWWSFPAGSVASLVLTVAYYRWGKWRDIRLMAPIVAAESEERTLADGEPGGRLHPSG
ncbi:MAG TPA: MATE family efflux transporter [Sphingomonadaceae bacterium]|nr:MATE family efflux transporter [Sphingomonadaceae bacterium]